MFRTGRNTQVITLTSDTLVLKSALCFRLFYTRAAATLDIPPTQQQERRRRGTVSIC
jgi:hypothetical protein